MVKPVSADKMDPGIELEEVLEAFVVAVLLLSKTTNLTLARYCHPNRLKRDSSSAKARVVLLHSR